MGARHVAGAAADGHRQRYLDQIAVSCRPSTVEQGRTVAAPVRRSSRRPSTRRESFGQVGRVEVEAFKLALAAHRTANGPRLFGEHVAHHVGDVRSFFDRIIEWDWPDAPPRPPIFAIDVPAADRPAARGSSTTPKPPD